MLRLKINHSSPAALIITLKNSVVTVLTLDAYYKRLTFQDLSLVREKLGISKQDLYFFLKEVIKFSEQWHPLETAFSSPDLRSAQRPRAKDVEPRA